MQARVMYAGGRIGIYGGDPKRIMADLKALKPTVVAMVPRLMNRMHE